MATSLTKDEKVREPSSLTKLNPAHEKEAREFIEQITGEHLQGEFCESLKSGVTLCNFINKLKPGSVGKINKNRMPFMQMENIGSYLTACRDAGIDAQYLFVTVDLFEAKNPAIVALNIIAVKRKFGYGFDKDGAAHNIVFEKY